jgi:hypothetical protein
MAGFSGDIDSLTAADRNSVVGLFPIPIGHLPASQLAYSTFPGKIHSVICRNIQARFFKKGGQYQGHRSNVAKNCDF